MAQVMFTPYPTVQPREAPPEDYLRVQATPRAFGEQVGVGLERAGQGAIRAGEFYNQVAADDQANQTLDGIDKLLYGDPSANNPGLLGMRGADAQRAYPQVIAQMRQLRDQARNNLATPEAQLEYDRQTRYLYRQGEFIAGRHYDQEMRTWAQGVNKASGALALNGIARAAATGDQNEVNLRTNDLIAARVKEAQTIYGMNLPPDIVQSIQRGARAEAVSQQVDILAPHDPGHASQILDSARDLLTGPEYDQLYSKVKGASTDQEAQQFVYGSGATPVPGVGAVPRNNPGNIRPAGSTTGFVAYPSLQDGYNAISHNLDAYAARGINTVAGVISRWAPPNENPTAQLIAQAAQRVGVSPTQPIDIRDPETKQKLIGAIVRQEQGREADPEMARAAAFMAPLTENHQPGDSDVPGLSAEISRIYNSGLSPDAKQKAAELARLKYTASWTDQTRSYEARERAEREANEQRANEIISNPGAFTSDQIQRDPSLKWETKISLMKALENKALADPNSAATKAYGEGFWPLYQRVTAPQQGMLAPITDPTELLRRAGPGGDLTLDGVAKLSQVMAAMRRPEQAGDTKLQAGALAYAKHQLSFAADYGTFKVRDPKGEDAFNIGFLPAFMHYWEAGIAAGKAPSELVAKDQIDKLVAPYKRPEAELMRDQLQAGTEATATAPTPATSPPAAAIAYLRANPQLRAAFDQKYGAGASATVLGPAEPQAPMGR